MSGNKSEAFLNYFVQMNSSVCSFLLVTYEAVEDEMKHKLPPKVPANKSSGFLYRRCKFPSNMLLALDPGDQIRAGYLDMTTMCMVALATA